MVPTGFMNARTGSGQFRVQFGRDSTRAPGPSTDTCRVTARADPAGPPPGQHPPAPRIRLQPPAILAPSPVEADVPDLAARPEPGAPSRLPQRRAHALPDTDRDRVRSRVQDDPLAAHAEVVIDAAEQNTAGRRPAARDAVRRSEPHGEDSAGRPGPGSASPRSGSRSPLAHFLIRG